MNKSVFNSLLQERNGDVIKEVNFDALSECQKLIIDNDYFYFVTEVSNGGFFLNSSLQFYSFIKKEDFRNIEFVNSIFQHSYGKLFSNLYTIAQDVFGNQFVFNKSTNSFQFFNIETADAELMGQNFEEFIKKLLSDIDFYSGRDYKEMWNQDMKPNQRLCPKKPFIIGGEYEVTNFYASEFPKYIEYFSDIAKQLHELPDGTPIKLRIIE